MRAKSYSDDAAGKFKLTLTQLAPTAAPAAPIPLTLGREVRGTLTANDPMIATESYGEDDDSVTESGRPYRLYSLTGVAGDEVEIRLMSDEFDSFLEVGADTPLGFSVAASNDDGGEEGDNLNSRLRIKFENPGTVIIRASPLGPDTGSYRIVANRPTTPATSANNARH